VQYSSTPSRSPSMAIRKSMHSQQKEHSEEEDDVEDGYNEIHNSNVLENRASMRVEERADHSEEGAHQHYKIDNKAIEEEMREEERFWYRLTQKRFFCGIKAKN
jgi:RimJ/RimL family protein N-acetyltransferase